MFGRMESRRRLSDCRSGQSPFLCLCTSRSGCLGLFSSVTRRRWSFLPVDSAIGLGPGLILICLTPSIDNGSVTGAVRMDSETTGRPTRQAWPRYLQTYLQQCSGRFSNRVED